MALRAGITALAAGDVDADGDLDLVATTSADGSVRVLRNQADATFQAAAAFGTSAADGASVALCGMDSDGRLDAVAVANAGLSGSILYNDGN